MAFPSEPRLEVYGAEISGKLVLLDVRADRYFLAIASPAQGDAPHPTSALAGVAIDPALAAWRPSGARWPQGPFEGPAGLIALACIHHIAKRLTPAPFAALVDAVRQAPARPRRRAPAVEALLASYEAVRPLYPKARICRLDAPATCLLLRRFGYPARLMFGARLEPFSAHCWAELEGAVLNEAPEAVAQFRPILAV